MNPIVGSMCTISCFTTEGSSGAPLTQGIARSYGADGYAKDASEAVQEAIRVLSVLRGGAAGEGNTEHRLDGALA